MEATSKQEDSEALCSVKTENAISVSELKQDAETKIAENGDDRDEAEEEASEDEDEEERIVEETRLPESLLYKEPAYAGRHMQYLPYSRQSIMTRLPLQKSAPSLTCIHPYSASSP